MSPCLAHLRGGRRHGQTVEIAQLTLCLLLREDDGFAVYDLCVSGNFSADLPPTRTPTTAHPWTSPVLRTSDAM